MLEIEPGPGSVISWYQRFDPGGRIYHFAAVRVAGRGWYVTGRIDQVVSWAELTGFIGDNPAYIASGWLPMPHVSPVLRTTPMEVTE